MEKLSNPVAVVAGHICLDITPAFETEGLTAAQLLLPGKLTRVGAADVHTGGCVANTGLALHHFGVRTRLFAKVGDDALGALIQTLLAAEQADATLAIDSQSSTSYSIVVALPHQDRAFWHNAGANERFSQADVPDALLDGASLFHFGYPPLMLRLCQNGGAELLTLFKRVKARGLMLSLDMAAVDPNAEAAQTDWPALLAMALPMVDFFLPSAEELCFMLDKPRYADWLERASERDVTAVLDIQADIAPLAAQLIDMGAKVAVVKCGARGLYYQTADAHALRASALPLDPTEWASKLGFVPAYRPGRVVSATGAGDTSIAAFLASMLEGLPLLRCVQRAAATGACCVEAYDALSSLKPLSEIDTLLTAGWPINP